MGRKINPDALRLGINKVWKSTWFAKKTEYPKLLGQDLKIRKTLSVALRPAGLAAIEINRFSGRVEIEVSVARPGVAIGRGGEGIDKLQKDLKRMTKSEVEIKIKEVKKPDISARVIARSIADGIERRQPQKLLMVAAKEKAMLSGAKGVKIQVSGRINNASQARTIKELDGAVPLQTMKANIDYAEEVAETGDNGLFGVKVWVYEPDNKEELRNN